MEKVIGRLISWEGVAMGLIAMAVILVMSGCSTKWEQKVGDYEASVYWGADFKEHKEDEQ